MSFPSPRGEPPVGHLGRWGTDPLALLDEGARLGPVFGLRLWRRAVLGYSPQWNRFVLGDLETFRSKGSMSGLTPYLGAGLVRLDAPAHQVRRRQLNPAFHRRSVDVMAALVSKVVRSSVPVGHFDAVAWSSTVMQSILAATFFDGDVASEQLAAFLGPLDRALPAPFLPRPWLFRRMNRVLAQRIAQAPSDSMAAAFQGLPDGVDEMRVALSAGYDTTAHTLAWLVARVAQDPLLLTDTDPAHVIDEVLRLYPAGWLGSRRAATDTEFDGVAIRRGTMVLYSPYLTHRSEALWDDPLRFDPGRFDRPVPAWGFIPFAAGERTCLGRGFARMVLGAALAVLAESRLDFTSGDLRPGAGITLRPQGEFLVRRVPHPAGGVRG